MNPDLATITNPPVDKKTRRKAKVKAYYEANKDKIKAYKKAWVKANMERVLTRVKAWAKANPEKRRAIARRFAARRRATPKGRIDERMSVAIGEALRGNKAGRSWEQLVGYTLDDLKRHIESNFQPGMNWERLLLGQIQIDHIIPKIRFKYQNPEDLEFRRCWAMENLQPLWATENLEKADKITQPRQIALGV